MLYLLIVLIGGLLSFFGPWWSIAPVCFLLCWLLPRKTVGAFWVSALAGITVWLGYMLYVYLTTGVAMTDKVASIFTASVPSLAQVPGAALVSLIAALIIVPVSGFSGLAGAKVKQLIRQPRG
ncbi:hypothetical protein [Parapedobacter sp. DT-150]|uniref:hypothetical protein n=1 Tax=Parapedobacter sp. DT-150 TaxID=3396162 RepID=UPI003F1C0469